MPRAAPDPRSPRAPRPSPDRHSPRRLWTLTGDASRRAWKLSAAFLHRTRSSITRCSSTRATARRSLPRRAPGHLGPTVFRSGDNGRTWKEAPTPPAFAPDSGRVVDHVLVGAGPRARSPASGGRERRRRAFSSNDAGATWEGVAGFNEHRSARPGGGDQDGTPDGPKMHSGDLVDPRDPPQLYTSACRAAARSSCRRRGRLAPAQQGVRADFQLEPRSSGTRIACACAGGNPDRLYVAEPLRHLPPRPACHRWTDIGTGGMSKGDIRRLPWSRTRTTPIPRGSSDGRDQRVARVSPGGKPAAYRTRDGGDVEAPGGRDAEIAGVVDRQAPGDDRRPASDSGCLLRHDLRRGLGHARRGPDVEVPRAASAGDLCGGARRKSRHAGPSPSRSRRCCAATPTARRGGGDSRVAGPAHAGRRASRRSRPTTRASGSAWSTGGTRAPAHAGVRRRQIGAIPAATVPAGAEVVHRRRLFGGWSRCRGRRSNARATLRRNIIVAKSAGKPRVKFQVCFVARRATPCNARCRSHRSIASALSTPSDRPRHPLAGGRDRGDPAVAWLWGGATRRCRPRWEDRQHRGRTGFRGRHSRFPGRRPPGHGRRAVPGRGIQILVIVGQLYLVLANVQGRSCPRPSSRRS